MNAAQFTSLSLIFALSFFEAPAYSEPISVTLPDKIIANADFREGDPQRPVIFLLHGFMATHELNILQILADALENLGYTVVVPTLSLKINNRRSGANCDAVHTHTMDSDVEEIAWWIDWVKNKGNGQTIVIGFSTGVLQLSIYLSRNTPPWIKKALFISPAYLAGNPFPQAEENAEIALAREMLAKSNNQLREFHLSYCKGDFVAPPKVFLSYKEWTADKLLDKMQLIKIPYVVILGAEDHRFGARLGEKLAKTRTRVITIPGANHFFDSPYEFDLLDRVAQEVNLP